MFHSLPLDVLSSEHPVSSFADFLDVSNSLSSWKGLLRKPLPPAAKASSEHFPGVFAVTNITGMSRVFLSALSLRQVSIPSMPAS